MKLNALVIVGAAVLLSSGTGAAAYALVGDATTNPTDSGNSLPIDDNHRASATPSPRTSVTPEHATPEHATPEPRDDHGVEATPEVEHTTPEPGDDKGVDATTDDRGGHSGSGSSGKGGSDDGSGHS